ncbi:MAG: S-layer homology domain-containing protein, partial [Clostridia bacterium]|nr:S-layer homology domain-containing protein [Clostridia bacterium]
ATGHAFGEWKVTVAAGCETDGKEERACANCDAVENRTLSAAGHVFGEWIVTVTPTMVTAGEQERSCENCGATETEELAKLEMNNPFTDVKEGKWYTEGILWCLGKGYMAGMSDTVFGYKETVTRAMFATILAGIDGADTSSYTEMSFSDVKPGQWYSGSIEWAASNGYAAGLGNGIFGYKQNVTREQLAMFLYTYSEKNQISVTRRADLSGYDDYGRIHEYALEALSWAVKEGLISGTSQTTLAPRDSATRAEIALIIKNYVENVKEAKTVIAGTDSGIVRDGTPKKYFTLSFDDGITQDAKIIEILKKYDVDCCTFNINTGLYGVSWPAVGVSLGRPDITHIRYSEEELMTGIYDGYDVEVHTLHHPALGDYDSNPEYVIDQVATDAANIEKVTGITPVGMAWPGGDAFYTDKTIEIIMENTDIRFARGTTSTYGFKLPEYFMKWLPTCSVSDPLVLEYAKSFLRTPCTEDMLFYVWGHGYEFDFYHSYDTFEALIKMISEADDVVLVTNAEFYQLFKDEIPSWK